MPWRPLGGHRVLRWSVGNDGARISPLDTILSSDSVPHVLTLDLNGATKLVFFDALRLKQPLLKFFSFDQLLSCSLLTIVSKGLQVLAGASITNTCTRAACCKALLRSCQMHASRLRAPRERREASVTTFEILLRLRRRAVSQLRRLVACYGFVLVRDVGNAFARPRVAVELKTAALQRRIKYGSFRCAS